MLADAITTLLKNDATIATITGGRVFPVPLPQGTEYPAVTFFIVSELRDHTLTEPTNIARPRVQIDVWTIGRNDMHALSKAVRRALDGFSGTVSGVDPYSAPFISKLQGVFLENRQELYEPDTKTQHGVLDFFVWNDEAQEQ